MRWVCSHPAPWVWHSDSSLRGCAERAGGQDGAGHACRALLSKGICREAVEMAGVGGSGLCGPSGSPGCEQ